MRKRKEGSTPSELQGLTFFLNLPKRNLHPLKRSFKLLTPPLKHKLNARHESVRSGCNIKWIAAPQLIGPILLLRLLPLPLPLLYLHLPVRSLPTQHQQLLPPLPYDGIQSHSFQGYNRAYLRSSTLPG